MFRRDRTESERFEDRVQKTDRLISGCPELGPCWEWIGHINPEGYGIFFLREKRKNILAHRFAYELLVGPIPIGLQPDHLCHTYDDQCPGGISCPHRSCVNPQHLEPVTPSENTLRGLGSKHQSRKIHCPQGHPYTQDNLRQNRAKNGRQCRLCHRNRERIIRKYPTAVKDGSMMWRLKEMARLDTEGMAA